MRGARTWLIDTYSPLGILAPGVSQIGEYFARMWQQAEEDPKRWGRMYS